MANHSSSRTTKVYDRRNGEASLDGYAKAGGNVGRPFLGRAFVIEAIPRSKMVGEKRAGLFDLA